jgi:hypothetical protein
MFLVGGLGALVLTPVVYRIRTAGATSDATARWFWPTWWMLIPLLFAIAGAVLVLLPESFDLRRSLLRSRFVTRLRGRQ